MSRRKRASNGNNENTNGQNSKETKRSSTQKARIKVTAKSENQKKLLKSIKDNVVTIVYGPPGSGKTLLAVVSGLREFVMGKYKKMIFTRPCVEAVGENLGFLPGDLHEKIHPYMYPIFDFLGDFLTQKQIDEYLKSENIITLPLAFQRGITFSNSFVLLDEAQNTRPEQIRMFLTRIGENCKIVITGDPLQSDIRCKNGLVDACERLVGVESLGIVEFNSEDIVRHPIVTAIEKRYESENKGVLI
jgi:phosphate starvation-inducible protein PhoH and related proteins